MVQQSMPAQLDLQVHRIPLPLLQPAHGKSSGEKAASSSVIFDTRALGRKRWRRAAIEASFLITTDPEQLLHTFGCCTPQPKPS